MTLLYCGLLQLVCKSTNAGLQQTGLLCTNYVHYEQSNRLSIKGAGVPMLGKYADEFAEGKP